MATDYSTQEIKQNVDWLTGQSGDLTDYQILTLAIEMQRNRMFADAFVLRDGFPSAPEAIAMALKDINT